MSSARQNPVSWDRFAPVPVPVPVYGLTVNAIDT